MDTRVLPVQFLLDGLNGSHNENAAWHVFFALGSQVGVDWKKKHWFHSEPNEARQERSEPSMMLS